MKNQITAKLKISSLKNNPPGKTKIDEINQNDFRKSKSFFLKKNLKKKMKNTNSFYLENDLNRNNENISNQKENNSRRKKSTKKCFLKNIKGKIFYKKSEIQNFSFGVKKENEREFIQNDVFNTKDQDNIKKNSDFSIISFVNSQKNDFFDFNTLIKKDKNINFLKIENTFLDKSEIKKNRNFINGKKKNFKENDIRFENEENSEKTRDNFLNILTKKSNSEEFENNLLDIKNNNSIDQNNGEENIKPINDKIINKKIKKENSNDQIEDIFLKTIKEKFRKNKNEKEIKKLENDKKNLKNENLVLESKMHNLKNEIEALENEIKKKVKDFEKEKNIFLDEIHRLKKSDSEKEKIIKENTEKENLIQQKIFLLTDKLLTIEKKIKETVLFNNDKNEINVNNLNNQKEKNDFFSNKKNKNIISKTQEKNELKVGLDVKTFFKFEKKEYEEKLKKYSMEDKNFNQKNGFKNELINESKTQNKKEKIKIDELLNILEIVKKEKITLENKFEELIKNLKNTKLKNEELYLMLKDLQNENSELKLEKCLLQKKTDQIFDFDFAFDDKKTKSEVFNIKEENGFLKKEENDKIEMIKRISQLEKSEMDLSLKIEYFIKYVKTKEIEYEKNQLIIKQLEKEKKEFEEKIKKFDQEKQQLNDIIINKQKESRELKEKIIEEDKEQENNKKNNFLNYRNYSLTFSLCRKDKTFKNISEEKRMSCLSNTNIVLDHSDISLTAEFKEDHYSYQNFLFDKKNKNQFVRSYENNILCEKNHENLFESQNEDKKNKNQITGIKNKIKFETKETDQSVISQENIYNEKNIHIKENIIIEIEELQKQINLLKKEKYDLEIENKKNKIEKIINNKSKEKKNYLKNAFSTLQNDFTKIVEENINLKKKIELQEIFQKEENEKFEYSAKLNSKFEKIIDMQNFEIKNLKKRIEDLNKKKTLLNFQLETFKQIIETKKSISHLKDETNYCEKKPTSKIRKVSSLLINY